MKQIIQSFKTGENLLEEVPAPLVKPGPVLIKTTRSLVSLGIEHMQVEFGRRVHAASAKKKFRSDRRVKKKKVLAACVA
jgi:hypothetical protein